MRRAILGAATLLFAGAAAAEPLAPPLAPGHFLAFVEQDGRRVALVGVVHLQRRPFAIVLRGEDPPAYYVATSLDEKALNADLGAVFAYAHAGAEGDQDVALFVNPAGRIPGSTAWVFQYWFVDNVHNRFQRVGTDPDGLISARRDLAEVDVGRRRLPIERWSGAPIHITIAEAPPTAEGTPADPQTAVLVFQ